jgi:hypothetical protein
VSSASFSPVGSAKLGPRVGAKVIGPRVGAVVGGRVGGLVSPTFVGAGVGAAHAHSGSDILRPISNQNSARSTGEFAFARTQYSAGRNAPDPSTVARISCST